MQLSREDIISTYKLLLGREPESDDVVRFYQCFSSYSALLIAFAGSAEFKSRLDKNSSFWWYNSQIDALKIIASHEDKNRQPMEEHLVNYLGVAVNVKRFFPTLTLATGLEPAPIPANWHADMAEFAAVLRAVELSGNTFTMIELGCGWGCWMNNSGAAARRMGKQVMLVGVEGDASHVEFAHESMKTNGFRSDQYAIIKGIATAFGGVALFPQQDIAGSNWGSSPLLDPSREQEDKFTRDGAYVPVRTVPLREVIGDHRRIDLLHVDIQGGESELVEGTVKLLADRIAYLVIGTHSREIEGRLMKTMLDAGWALEIERPCIFGIRDGHPELTVDGVQGWRNPAFDRL